ncbi:MAG: TonB-dependent receptor plug domain-containing protein, partial [Bacteroidota bacterium]
MYSQADSDSTLWSIDMEDIVVTAQFIPTSKEQVVHDIRTIDRVTIERQGATNLEQLLSQDASIRIRQDAILGSSMSILGLDGQNVQIMIDGVPIIGRQGGNIDLSQINLHNIERVEIVEGPLAVQYGTNALAGVINLIRKKSQVERFRVKTFTQVEDRGENNYVLNLGAQLADDLQLTLVGGFDRFDGFSEDTLRS